MNPFERALHQRALDVSQRYRSAEADLLEVLEKLDEKKVFRALGYSSLFQYAISELKLSESTAYCFITVARKAREIPEIKAEIKAGTLSVAKVKRVVPVLEKENATIWLEKAKTLPKAALEKEVAKVSPQVLTPEKSKYVTEKRLSLQLGVREELYERLGRVKDLLSQKLRRAASLEDALEAMTDLYLEREDPVERARRAQIRRERFQEEGEDKSMLHSDELGPGPVVKSELQAKSGKRETDLEIVQVAKSVRRKPIPAAVKHAVTLRDGGQCAHMGIQGERCEQRRWLDMHHHVPKSQGGADTVENLQLLCFHHHRAVHGAAG